MAIKAKKRMRSYSGTVCPHCDRPIQRLQIEAGSGNQECPYCHNEYEGVFFTPPVYRTRVHQLSDSPDAKAACEIHERNSAVANCSRCGNFICNLCKIDADNMILCPACFERLSNEGALASAQTSIRHYAGIASNLVAGGILCWPFAIFLGPAGFVFGLKALKQKKEMGESDGILGVYLALVLGVLETVGAALLVAALFGAFNSHGHR